MANEAPDRIWAWTYTGGFGRGEWLVHETSYADTEYIRADLATLSSEQARDALNELDQLRERVKELEKVCTGIRKIVEEIDGTMKHGTWRDEKGSRLKDTPEWVEFYNTTSARRAREGGKV